MRLSDPIRSLDLYIYLFESASQDAAYDRVFSLNKALFLLYIDNHFYSVFRVMELGIPFLR